MKNSIENMWKEGFLEEGALDLPKINILYKIKSRLKFNLKLIIVLATAWLRLRQIERIKALETGHNNYDYLKSFQEWLDTVLLKNGSVIRFTYPIYFLIVMSMLFSSWSSQEELANEVVEKFPDVTFIRDVPLMAWIITAVITVLMLVFSKKIYLFDVRLMYGHIFDKLDATMEEMESLRA